MIDSRQLEMFQQVIDAGSFSAAARALHCSQPAISQQMRTLERAMGGPLFIRVGRALQLTEAGKVLARHSATILGRSRRRAAAGAGDLRARPRHRADLRVPERERVAGAADRGGAAGGRARTCGWS